MKTPTASLILASLVTLAAPSAAHAQFRANAQLGVEHLRRDGSGATMFQARAEMSFRTAAWMDVGGYVQHLERLDAPTADSGWGLGVIATLRPMPEAALGPLAFGSIGYQRAPEATLYRDGLFVEVGGGIAWRPAPVVDLELRGGFVGLLGGQSDLTGFTAGIGLSLHP